MVTHTSQYHALRVLEIITETDDAKSIVFETPADGTFFDYRPGQFLTLRIPAADAQVVRCYSLASAPVMGEPMKVTVKRVNGGVASNWICDQLRTGDELQVMPPVGVFTPRQLDGDFLLFAGGSGVTPIMSILKSALFKGSGRIAVFYANRDERSVIFAEELRTLARQYPQRLMVYHWLQNVQGLPDVPQIASLAAPYATFEAFVCGPEPFMDCVTAALFSLNFSRQKVHVERFVSLSTDPGEERSAPEQGESVEPGTALEVSLDGASHTLDWQRETTLLDTMLAANMAAPFSCREGKCSACMCKVLEGEVSMRHNYLLDATDLAEGWVLACQAVPDTSRVHVSFDE